MAKTIQFSELAIGARYTYPDTRIGHGYYGTWIKTGTKKIKCADNGGSGFPVYVDFPVVPVCEFCDGSGKVELAGWWAVSETAIEIDCEACHGR